MVPMGTCRPSIYPRVPVCVLPTLAVTRLQARCFQAPMQMQIHTCPKVEINSLKLSGCAIGPFRHTHCKYFNGRVRGAQLLCIAVPACLSGASRKQRLVASRMALHVPCAVVPTLIGSLQHQPSITQYNQTAAALVTVWQ